MTLAILLFGLVVATCFIAYIADNIGKNLGKKRISLKIGRYSIRPRQTATLISMASSVGVMLLTVGLLLLSSKSISNALLRYDEKIREANAAIEKLQSDRRALLKNASEQRATNKRQLEDIALNRTRAAKFLSDRQIAESQLQGVGARLLIARKGEANARARASQAQSQLNGARRQFQTFKAQLTTAKSQVAAAKARVQNAQAQVGKAQRQLRSEQGQVASTRAQLKAARQERKAAGEELKKAQADLDQAARDVARIDASMKVNLKQLTEAETEMAELDVRRNQLQAASDEQTRQLEKLKTDVNYYQEVAEKIATGDVAIQLGEVFAEKTVAPNASTREARIALSELMTLARSELSNPPRTLVLDLPSSVSNLSEDEFLNGFAAYLSTLSVPVSLRLAAVRDHARGETEIHARLMPIAVRTIFSRDEVLASAAIDSAGGDARIFNQLLTLLNENEKRARARGVTPLLSPQNPLFYPTGTNERVFEALRKIQSLGAEANVRLLAAEDITSIDSPRVRFEISKQ